MTLAHAIHDRENREQRSWRLLLVEIFYALLRKDTAQGIISSYQQFEEERRSRPKPAEPEPSAASSTSSAKEQQPKAKKPAKPTSGLAALMEKEKQKKFQSLQQQSRLGGTFVKNEGAKKIISAGESIITPSKEKHLEKPLLGRKRKKVARVAFSSGIEAQSALKEFVDEFLDMGCYTGLIDCFSMC